MDLNFGEIVLDPVSRAFIDDYEEESTFQSPEIIWSSNYDMSKISENIDDLILVEGKNAVKLLKIAKILNESAHVCKIRNTDVYKLSPATVLCVSEEKDLNYHGSIGELLSEMVEKSKSVTCVSLQQLMDFKSDKIPDGCFFKGINSKFSSIEALPSPNFLTGLSAAFSTKRLFHDLPFSCYMIYIDLYDEINIRKVLNHFQQIGLKHDENLKVIEIEQSCNLYM